MLRSAAAPNQESNYSLCTTPQRLVRPARAGNPKVPRARLAMELRRNDVKAYACLRTRTRTRTKTRNRPSVLPRGGVVPPEAGAPNNLSITD
jgi:hypothetical protein